MSKGKERKELRANCWNNPLTGVMDNLLWDFRNQLILCLRPSIIDEQDTLATMEFAVDSGKVKKFMFPLQPVTQFLSAHEMLVQLKDGCIKVKVSEVLSVENLGTFKIQARSLPDLQSLPDCTLD